MWSLFPFDLNPTHSLEGIILRSTGSWYEVLSDSGTYSCTIRGKFRLADEEATNPIVIGDRVLFDLNEDQSGIIVERLERHNKLSRRAAGRRQSKEHVIVANVDKAWIVQSIRNPRINPGFIDRVIVMAEYLHVPAGIIFNKADLMDEAAEEVVMFFAELYESLGYPVVFSSTKVDGGSADLLAQLEKGIHVFIGPSGVGKSSLLNTIVPDSDLKTGAISESTQKGKHTTTYAELIRIPNGGFIGDTPGLREFGLYSIPPEELSHYFVEFRDHMHDCRFPNCTHDHEPDCKIKELVKADELAVERYESYINMLAAARLGKLDVGR
jgi:ribosome biogenesis GTPase / thiamine phosphate phosphatase